MEMVSTPQHNTTAMHWMWASIVNSLLLPTAAAFHFDVPFWGLVVTNFFLMHAVWLTQLIQGKTRREIDLVPVRWSLVSFAGLGNLALLLWCNELLSVFFR